MTSLPLLWLIGVVAITSVINNNKATAHNPMHGKSNEDDNLDLTDVTEATEVIEETDAPEEDDIAEQEMQQTVLVSPTKNTLNLGKIIFGDVLLAHVFYIKKPCKDKVHVQDIVMTGNSTIKITAIRVEEVGSPQGAVASIKEGGIGKNYVIIRLKSAKGAGYHFETKVWGVKLHNRFHKRKFATLFHMSPS